MNPLIACHDFGIGLSRPLLQRGIVRFILMIADDDTMFVHERLTRTAPLLKLREKIDLERIEITLVLS